MLYSNLYESLPNLISAIGQQYFYAQVAESIQKIDAINDIKIVSYSKTDRPVFLGECPMSKMDKIYCESAYLMDPVYNLLCQHNNRRELVTLDSLVAGDFYHSDYYDNFYQALGWDNETNILIRTQDDRSICIVCETKNNPSQNTVYNELTLVLDQIKAAVQTHERVYSSLHSTPTARPTKFNDIDYTASLTKREKQIVRLILDGLSSNAIAEKCFVSEGTIKNHRKNIYRKLGVKSQAELFHHFIN